MYADVRLKMMPSSPPRRFVCKHDVTSFQGPNNISVWLVYQKTATSTVDADADTDTYQHCAAAAAAAIAAGAGNNISAARYFSWWGHVDSRSTNDTVFRCWLSSVEGWENGYSPLPSPALKTAMVSGFRDVPRSVLKKGSHNPVAPPTFGVSRGRPTTSVLSTLFRTPSFMLTFAFQFDDSTHVHIYTRPEPSIPWGDGLCPGDCDCGPG